MVFLLFQSLREQYHLPQSAIRDIIIGTTVLCQDSVKIAEGKVNSRLKSIIPGDRDLGKCFDMTDDECFQDCGSNFLRDQFLNNHFHVVVCTLETILRKPQ